MIDTKTVIVTLKNGTQHSYRGTKGHVYESGRLLVTYYSDGTSVEYPLGSWVKVEIIPDSIE